MMKNQYIVPVVNTIQVCPFNSVLLDGTGGRNTIGDGHDAAPARGLYV